MSAEPCPWEHHECVVCGGRWRDGAVIAGGLERPDHAHRCPDCGAGYPGDLEPVG